MDIGDEEEMRVRDVVVGEVVPPDLEVEVEIAAVDVTSTDLNAEDEASLRVEGTRVVEFDWACLGAKSGDNASDQPGTLSSMIVSFSR